MPLDPAPLDPLPTPQLDQQQSKPQQQEDAFQPQPLPQGAGFTGKGGQAAFYADNLLRGVMAGRHIREEKKIKSAQQEVGNARSIYDAMADQYKTAIDNGVDQNSEDFKKLKQNVSSAWDGYLGAAGKYVTPEEGGKKKGKGKDGDHPHAEMFKKMFGVENPHMITEASLNILKQSGPMAFAYTPDKAKDLQRQAEQQQVEINKGVIQDQNRNRAQQADNDALMKERDKAIAENDQKKLVEIEEKLAGRGVNIQAVKSVEQREAEKITDKAKVTAVNDLAKLPPGGSPRDLSVQSQVMLGVPPVSNPFEAYLSEVGPGKKFKSKYDASRAYTKDQEIASTFGRAPTQWQEVRNATQVQLDHELQNPVLAKKYGLDKPLANGEKTPTWLVDKVTREGMNKTSAEERAALKASSDAAVTRSGKIVMKNLSPEDADFAGKYVFNSDETDGSLSVNFGEPDKKTHWLKGDTIGDSGLSAEEFRKKKTEVLGRTRQIMKKLYPDADDEVIDSALGLSKTMTPPPETGQAKKPIPQGNGRTLNTANADDQALAQQIFDEAGGDPNAARKLAKERGYNF